MEVFGRVQELLAGRCKTVTPRQRNREEFPLRGFVRCGFCNAPLTGSSTGKMKVKYLYYRCQNRSCTSPINVRAELLHEQFARFIRLQQPNPVFLKLFHSVITDVWNTRRADAVRLTRIFDQQLEEAKERKRKLLEAYIFHEN